MALTMHHTSDMENKLYAIAPKSDPRELYAAGYEANCFSSVEEAEQAIQSLKETGDPDFEWVVVEHPTMAVGTRVRYVGDYRSGIGYQRKGKIIAINDGTVTVRWVASGPVYVSHSCVSPRDLKVAQ